jgi:aldehyde dehydrogenase (NAD+)
MAFPDTASATGVSIGNLSRPGTGGPLLSRSPIDGQTLATLSAGTPAEMGQAIAAAHAAFLKWRVVPAPVRGELVRRIGDRIRARKEDLARIITLEAGKITQEALGEVQEWIDMCDFAVGLSRQLHGLAFVSERPNHRLQEQWHPLGVVGVISAFNFPMAVWAWNAMLALVCGDAVVWKPSEKTPLCALAAHQVAMEAVQEFDPSRGLDLISLVQGRSEVGHALASDDRVPLVSATGSTRMGQAVGVTVAQRLGRSLLELGGNNALILTPSADLDMALRAIVFSAVGTAGQRCTSLRRLIVHSSIRERVVRSLADIFARVPIGDPRTAGILVGPLVDRAAFDAMQHALTVARQQGGTVHGGERVQPAGTSPDAYYVRPALIELPGPVPITREETFAPILYVLPYENLDQAIALNNDVPQGLSSAIFTLHHREAEQFLAPAGSDCGIANVNVGTSGAEIGGAFGGEKQTGGGRESGSDAWKNYMRRTTAAINFGADLPLAQGIQFDVLTV